MKLSESAAAALTRERERETLRAGAGLVSQLPFLSDIASCPRLPGPGEGTGKCVARREDSAVLQCTAQYCTVHCQLALLLCQGKVVSGSAAAGAKCTQTHSQLQSAFNDFLGGSALA